MNNTKKRIGAVLVLMLMGLSVAVQASEGTQAVIDCMDANVPKSLRVQDIELAATRADSPDTTTLRGKVYVLRQKSAEGRETVRATLRIASPDYLKGASYLIRQSESPGQDGMYVFLPSVKRVRRISGEFSDGPLLGTNVSYYDFKQMQHAVGDAAAARERDDTLQDRPVYVITYTPTSEAGTKYSLVRLWVDQKSCVALQAEFMEGGKLRKRMSGDASALRQTGDAWYLSELRLDDLKDKSSTQVKFVATASGPELPTRLFDPKAFYLGN
ncbi:MAG: outer membrane lipoprotein-sorting protein [Pseudomonadota bacterium]|nr:outer membrane lipoprotein-sorting protein [Pseudomonadota bacterium]